MTIGRRRDAWQRAARLVSAWTGEPAAEIMPDFGDEPQTKRLDVLPYDEKLRTEIVSHFQAGGAWSG